MTDFPDVLLDHFRCSQCYCALSVGPVRSGPDGAPVCGRCPPNPRDVPNRPLQLLLARYAFPCRYTPHGCNETVPFDDVRHEQECQFREVAAPNEGFEAIDPTIVEDLKCSKCKKYLSVGPLSLTAEGDSVCGRCFDQWSEIYGEGMLVRNWKLEFVMQRLPLQCSNYNAGCRRALKWGQVQHHEDFCPSRSYSCPATPVDSCQVVLPATNFLQHFEEEHPDLILVAPKFKENLTQDSYTHRLLKLDELLYLIMSKVSVAENRLWMSVAHIGDVDVAEHLKYTFKFSNSEETAHLPSNEERVQSDLTLMMNEEAAVPMTLDGLRVFLRQPNLEQLVCGVAVNCEYSEPSKPTLMTCEWPDCDLIAEQSEMERHEKEFCLDREVECKWEECESVMPYRTLATHENECEERVEICPSCEEEIPYLTILEHESECEYKIINCEWPECKRKLPAYKMVLHEKECSERLVTCPFPDCLAACPMRLWDGHATQCNHRSGDSFKCEGCNARFLFPAISSHVRSSHFLNFVQSSKATRTFNTRCSSNDFVYLQFDGRLFIGKCDVDAYRGGVIFHLNLFETNNFGSKYKYVIKISHPSNARQTITRDADVEKRIEISSTVLSLFMEDKRIKYEWSIIKS